MAISNTPNSILSLLQFVAARWTGTLLFPSTGDIDEVARIRGSDPHIGTIKRH
jgi:hypothetical protein